MMRWLYVNGADTRDEDVDFCFPMYVAALQGHLDVCKWLFAHGAAKDVKRRICKNHPSNIGYPNGRSPLTIAFVRVMPLFGTTSMTSDWWDLSKWLILHGALCKDDDSGDLDIETMKQDLIPPFRGGHVEERKLLLEWANDLHRARTSFLLFLSGALSDPQHGNSTRRNLSPLQQFSGEPGIRELIGDYVGFVRGRKARIVRKLTEMLPNLS